MNPNISIVKYLFSFLKEIRIEKTQSMQNPLLEVTLAAGRFKLNTQNAVYSHEDRYYSYSTALAQLKEIIPGWKTALVLGTGLGSIPFILIDKYKFTGNIDCVEIDSEVIRLAKKYFPIQPLPHELQIIHDDASAFIQHAGSAYDLIAVDLFIDTEIPIQFYSEMFLQQLKSLVAPGGILLFSRLKSNRERELLLNTNLHQIFDGATEIDTGGNLILHWQSRRE